MKNEDLANINSRGKLSNECLFCKNRFCYERVLSEDNEYDELACRKHVKELHRHANIKTSGMMKLFISSTGVQKRGSSTYQQNIKFLEGALK